MIFSLFLFSIKELLELIKILFLKIHFLNVLFPNIVEGEGRCFFLCISVG